MNGLAMASAQQIDLRSTVLAAQDGDADALTMLLRTIGERLLPLASALCGGTGEADELLGDTLSRIYDRIGDLREPDAITSWARRVMVRRFIDRRRWLRRRPTVSIETVEIAAPPGSDVDQIDLRRAVSRLDRRDRALLALHYWQRATIAECAAELGIAEGTAKSRLNAALRRLRRELEDRNGN